MHIYICYLFDLYEESRLMFTDWNMFFPSLFEGHVKGKSKEHPLPSTFLPSFGRGTGREDQMFLTLRRVHSFVILLLKFFIAQTAVEFFWVYFPLLQRTGSLGWGEKNIARNRKGQIEDECMQEFHDLEIEKVIENALN